MTGNSSHDATSILHTTILLYPPNYQQKVFLLAIYYGVFVQSKIRYSYAFANKMEKIRVVKLAQRVHFFLWDSNLMIMITHITYFGLTSLVRSLFGNCYFVESKIRYNYAFANKTEKIRVVKLALRALIFVGFKFNDLITRIT